MKKHYLSLLLAALVLLGAGANATTFVETFNYFGDLFDDNRAAFWGHVFVPGKTYLEPETTEVPEVMYLLDWTYAKHKFVYDATGEAYLGVLTWDGTPENPTAGNRANSSIVGVSTNTVDIAAVPPHSLMTWEFDYLPLERDTTYAMFWLQPGEQEGTWNIVSGAVELEVSANYPWGGVIQIGWNTLNQPTWNPHFIATYDTITPYVGFPYPANGAERVEIDPVLDWSGPTAFEALGYEVYIDPNLVLVESRDPAAYADTVTEPGLQVWLDNGETYFWAVDTLEPNEPGDPTVNAGPIWSFETIPADVIIAEQPEAVTVPLDDTAELTVVALNAEHYQWYKDGVELTGETAAILTIENVQIVDEGVYYCVVSNELPSEETTVSVQLLTERQVGWWRLDGTLSDSIQEIYPDAPAHHGTAFDPNFVDGIDGQALEFYGNAEDIITIADSAEFYNFYPRGYSVSAWVQTEVDDSWGAYVSKQGGQPGAATGFILTKAAGGSAIHTLRQSFGDLWSNYFIANGAWHLVTGTYDATTGVGKIYVNGELRNQATSAGQPQPNAADLIFGAEWPDGSVPFIGLLDDVRIWSYPLDAFEVAELYVEFVEDVVICIEYPEFDVSGPDGVPDCIVNLYDFAVFARSWMENNLDSAQD